MTTLLVLVLGTQDMKTTMSWFSLQDHASTQQYKISSQVLLYELARHAECSTVGYFVRPSSFHAKITSNDPFLAFEHLSAFM